MSKLTPVLLGTMILGAASVISLPASALPMSNAPAASTSSGLIEKARTICNFDAYGRRFCYNTSGRPLYPRYRRPPPPYYGGPGYYPGPRYYRPY